MVYNQLYVMVDNMIIEANIVIREMFCNVVLFVFSLYQNNMFLTSANNIIEHQLMAQSNKNQIASEIVLIVLNIIIFFLSFTW